MNARKLKIGEKRTFELEVVEIKTTLSGKITYGFCFPFDMRIENKIDISAEMLDKQEVGKVDKA